MPYIVTTKRPGHAVPGMPTADFDVTVARRAVATPDEAREEAENRCPEVPAHDRAALRMKIALAVPEQGGTVGPLPDGRVIEVEMVEWRTIYESLGGEWLDRYREWEPEWDDHPQALDAYNAAQAVA